MLHIQRRAHSVRYIASRLRALRLALLSRVSHPKLARCPVEACSYTEAAVPDAAYAIHRRCRIGVCTPSGRWCGIRPLDGEQHHMGHPHHVVDSLGGHQRGHRLWKPVLDRRCGWSALCVCVGPGRFRDRPFRKPSLLASLHPHTVPGDDAARQWDCSLLSLRCAPPTAPRMFVSPCLKCACGPAAEIGTPLGDPENPPCARLVLTGSMVNHTSDPDEEKAARAALFGRHPYLARLCACRSYGSRGGEGRAGRRQGEGGEREGER